MVSADRGTDVKVGDRVTVTDGESAGEAGRVLSADASYVTVQLDDGSGLRLRRSGVVPAKMDMTEVEVEPDGSVEVCVDPSSDERDEMSLMASKSDFKVGDRITVTSARLPGLRGEPDLNLQGQSGTVTWVSPVMNSVRISIPGHDEMMVDPGKIRKMDREMSAVLMSFNPGDHVRWSIAGGGEGVVIKPMGTHPKEGELVEVQPTKNGQPTRAGTRTMPTNRLTKFEMSAVLMAASARCPYCSRQTAMSRGALGGHRAPGGGECDGSGRAVARLDRGAAVLMATTPPTGWYVKLRGQAGWWKVTDGGGDGPVSVKSLQTGQTTDVGAQDIEEARRTLPTAPAYRR